MSTLRSLQRSCLRICSCLNQDPSIIYASLTVLWACGCAHVCISCGSSARVLRDTEHGANSVLTASRMVLLQAELQALSGEPSGSAL